MDLIEIDYIYGQAPEAVFDLALDRISFQDFSYVALGIPPQATLGEDVRSWARPAFESTSDHFFRVSKAVDSGCIDPVDAKFERAMNRANGVIIVLRSPSELPARTSDAPCAVAYGSDAQIGIAEFACLHSCLPLKFHSIADATRLWPAEGTS